MDGIACCDLYDPLVCRDPTPIMLEMGKGVFKGGEVSKWTAVKPEMWEDMNLDQPINTVALKRTGLLWKADEWPFLSLSGMYVFF